MENFGATRTSIEYASKELEIFEHSAMFPKVVNRDFKTAGIDDPSKTRTISRKNQEFVITQLIGTGWQSGSGTGTLSYNKPTEVISRLLINNYLELKEEIETPAAFASAVADPEQAMLKWSANNMRQAMDKVVLGMYSDAGAGNWLGTDYVAGTVTVDVTTGAVTGSGTTFASGMVGRPFKAAGHTKWYRVKTFTNTTSIVIEDDSDDLTSAYTGGAIAGGSAYVIQAKALLNLTATTIKYYLDKLSAALDKNDIPNDGTRWMALPAAAAKPVLLAASQAHADIEKVYDKSFVGGEIYKAAGFNLYFLPDEWFTGNNTSGFYIPGGHRSFITGDYNYLELPHVIKAEDTASSWSNFIKGLFAYGTKVADERRKAGVCGFLTFSLS